ncbi:MAG: hypothetical protein R3217_09190 [Gammaproteobacteria bacterium]|nr:hypothetical protein [Gammaproteobacteria bacterium]
MRRLLFTLLLLSVFPAHAEQGWTINGGLSDVDEYGLGVDIGLGYFWTHGNLTTRFNFASGTAVADENDRYATETRYFILIAETICRDTETGNQVDEDKCSDSSFLYAPSLELAYKLGARTSLGFGIRGVENEAAYVFLENRLGEVGDMYLQIKVGDNYSGINFGWDFGVNSVGAMYRPRPD